MALKCLGLPEVDGWRACGVPGGSGRREGACRGWSQPHEGLRHAGSAHAARTADRDLQTPAISFTVTASVVLSPRNPLWPLGAGTCVSIVALYLSRFH
jgi:hypothetical protein